MDVVQKIKCVVWDLDNTIWKGILSEDKTVYLNKMAKDVVIELDKRGILQSISSKNDCKEAMRKLREFDMEQYFIYPQINWNPKSESVKKIAEQINIGIDTVAFIDDQFFELEEVKFANPEVLCIDAGNISDILKKEEFMSDFITEDSKNRRQMYLDDIKRKQEEETFSGSQIDFYKTLNMEIQISKATIDDLMRVEELTIRTHQLNSTGYIYSYEELCKLIDNSQYKLLVVNLKDRFGDYGKIGIVLIELRGNNWIIKLFLLSCRVISRGIGSIVLNYIKNKASQLGKRLCAEFVSTEKNRMMEILLMFHGFNKLEENILVCEDMTISECPDYITLKTDFQ